MSNNRDPIYAVASLGEGEAENVDNSNTLVCVLGHALKRLNSL